MVGLIQDQGGCAEGHRKTYLASCVSMKYLKPSQLEMFAALITPWSAREVWC